MEILNGLAQRFSAYGTVAPAIALKKLMQITHRQGVVMAFTDVFLLLTLVFAGLALAAIMVRRPQRMRPLPHIEATPFRAHDQSLRPPNKVQRLTSLSRGGQNVAPSVDPEGTGSYRFQESAT